ncbi:MAG: isocitrate/isopropylmalate dehydrogenase family protein [Deltaproteobacteria bacterium]|jgi:3-isopropylmalate dehydrogenase|nr:isocitrate/isopropylmalate dehydrogenase family protein [Deltaproteobacteria bacterium]
MKYEIAYLPGDGVGLEVLPQARKVLNRVAQIQGFDLKWRDFPFGANYYFAKGEVLPPGALDDLGAADILLLGAVGDPKVPPGPLEQELLLVLRFHFDQYLNLRPVQNYPNVPLPRPLAAQEKLDLVVVRENTEDFYMGLGGSFDSKTTSQKLAAKRKLYDFTAEITGSFSPTTAGAFSLGLLTEPGIRRVAKKAFELARTRGESQVQVATKANALPQFYGFWDQIVKSEATAYPDLKVVFLNVDNLCYQLPRDPSPFGVILCPNLFGDIVSDLAAALAGGLGLAASGNIGDGLSMFEPVHGSAPDIAGTGKANPLAAILSGAMALDRLGQTVGGQLVKDAVRSYLAKGHSLPIELGGQALTETVGDLVVAELKSA